MLAFPLGYLLFPVPVGESLIPLLQGLTAAFTIGARAWSVCSFGQLRRATGCGAAVIEGFHE